LVKLLKTQKKSLFFIIIPDSHRILEVSYKTIIDSYEFDHQERSKVNLEAENKKRLFDTTNPTISPPDHHIINYFSKNITIPPILKRINPKLREREYITLKKDPNFLHKVTSVCEECFLIIAKGNVAGGDYNIQRVRTNESTKMYGTGRLRPEVLKYRNKLTLRNIKYKGLIEDLRPDIKPQIINHLISPTKLFSSDKLFEIEDDRNINLKQSNERDSNFFDSNIIDLPIRGSIRGSVRNSFAQISNPKLPEKGKNIQNLMNFDQNRDISPRKLENVQENDDTLIDDSEDEEDDFLSMQDEQKEKNNKKLKLIPYNFDSTQEHTIENTQENHPENIQENHLEKNTQQKHEEVNENPNVYEKNSQVSGSMTDRGSKYLNTSDNLRKIFIPNLKNTTNSCNH